MKIIITTLLSLFFYSTVFSQHLSPLDPSLKNLAPENVFTQSPGKDFKFSDKSKSPEPSTFTVKPGTQKSPTFEAEVFKSSLSHYDVQASWKSTGEIKKGDVMLARFAMRSIYAKQESGEAVVNFYVQQTVEPFEKSIILALGAGPEWKEYNFPFIALRDMPAGEASICFSFGALAQKVELTEITLLNFKNKATLAQLPETKFTYAGREEKAAWREAALKRIEEIRRAPLVIQVVDSKGKPVKGASVSARLIDHEFMFGTAVTAKLLCEETPQSEIYRKNLKELFNTATIDNGLKWPVWMNPQSRECTKEAIEWINTNGFRLRGHNLVWPGKKFTPDFYKNQPDFGPGFSDSIINHIKEIASYTKGKVVAWDVINEMAHEMDYFNVMPRTMAAEWFKLAKQTDPNAQLFINEYGMLNSIASPKMIQTYIGIIDELKSYGAPIEAIGVQGHVGKQPRDPALVISDLDLLAKAGLPIQITEFDVNTKDEALQGDYTRDFLIACFSHPSVTGFVMWGFWESAHWKPDAALFRKDWTPKPNEAAWRELVTKTWSTNVSDVTAKNGSIQTKGYRGKYEITVTKKDGSTVKVYHQLTANSAPAKVKL
jgi:GH35 family endo-1,4-beta-xylanase